MKRLLCCLLLLALLPLYACTPPGPARILTSSESGLFYCAETGVTYRQRAASYLPLNLARVPYATYTNAQGARQSFFALSEGSETTYLAMADEEDYYPYFLIAAADYVMPTLSQMDPYEIVICTADEEAFWLQPNIYDHVRTIGVVKEIVSAFAAGEAVDSLPNGGSLRHRVELLFFSATYLDFAYNCAYYEYEDGSCYVREATGTVLRVASGLFDGYRLEPDESGSLAPEQK